MSNQFNIRQNGRDEGRERTEARRVSAAAIAYFARLLYNKTMMF